MGLPFVMPLLSIAMTCLLAQSAHGARRRTLLDNDGNAGASQDLIKPEAENEAPIWTLGAATNVPQNGIAYHSGPVLTGPLNLYLIWYGNWGPGSVEIPIITDFASGLGSSEWWAINGVFTDASMNPASTSLTYVSRTFDYYSRGAKINDQDIARIVESTISTGALPLDPQGIYFIVGSADVDEDGFCTRYCGWHGRDTIQGVAVTLGYVGDTTRCPKQCMVQPVGPNGASGADGTASVLAHELTEAITDPTLNGWFDAAGLETADKCAWQFGATGIAQNGGHYNMWVNGRYYLIQENWVNLRGGYCAMSLKQGVSDGR